MIQTVTQFMTQSAAPNTSVTLPLLEVSLTLLAIGVAFCLPRIFSTSFASIEKLFGRLARRQGLSVAIVGFLAVALRLAILPFIPIPIPFVTDDFSFLLAADTFGLGRLTNPTPAMWTHFETMHETMHPTYMSMYFPSQGLVLAAGKLLFGHPWFGLLAVTALMCAAICWMLQAWLPPTWALLGGLLAVIHLGLFTYWINTYHSGGSIAALGGALILGALPRLQKTARFRYGMLIAIGLVLLAYTRPYEGVLLSIPVAIAIGHWAIYGKTRPHPAILLRRAAAPMALIVAACAWLGYYDYRAFGSPTTLPYTIDRATYAMAPYFVWQSPRPEPVYRHVAMRSFYYACEMDFFNRIHSPTGYPIQSLVKAIWATHFYTGIALLPPLAMLWWVIRDRRLRFLVICVGIMIAGMAIQIYLIPHYIAPFTAAFYAIGLQSMRHLRLWRSEGKPVGLALSRFCILICLAMVGLRLYAGPLHLRLAEFPVTNWNFEWYGPDHFGTERERVIAQMEQLPGKQLMLVRYSAKHNPMSEWVYNGPEIDNSKIIWAREMDAANNADIIQHYKDRKVWLVEPDKLPAVVSPYSETDQHPNSGQLIAAAQ